MTTQPFDAGPRFEVRCQLGAGGMGVVYEAYDHERNELVALKTLRRTDGGWLTQFKREFRAIHDLAHPNLVAFNELFELGRSAKRTHLYSLKWSQGGFVFGS